MKHLFSPCRLSFFALGSFAQTPRAAMRGASYSVPGDLNSLGNAQRPGQRRLRGAGLVGPLAGRLAPSLVPLISDGAVAGLKNVAAFLQQFPRFEVATSGGAS